MITFEPGQTELEYEMEIVDDDEWEPDEEFYVKVDDDDDEWEPDEESYVKVSFDGTAQSPVMIMTRHTYPETEKMETKKY